MLMKSKKTLLLLLIFPFWFVLMLAAVLNFSDLIFVPKNELNGYQVHGFPYSIAFLSLNALLLVRYLVKKRMSQTKNLI